MKKITSIVLAVLMVLGTFAVLPFAVSADVVLSETVLESKTVAPGDEFDVLVTVTGEPGITMWGFTIQWESEYLEVLAVEDLTGKAMGEWSQSSNMLGWGGVTNVPELIEETEGKLCKIKCKALDAEGQTTLQLTIYEQNETATGSQNGYSTGGVITIEEPANSAMEPIALYTGEDIEFIGENAAASLQTSYVNNIATATLPGFTGNDHIRVQVKTPGALKGDGARYMAYGIRISNVDPSDADTTNRYAEESGTAQRKWGGDDRNQQYSTTEIKKHVIDFSKFNEWDKVLDTDKLLGIYLNPWNASENTYTCPEGTVIEIEYIAFFKTPEAAEAYVYGVTSAVEPLALIRGEDIKISDPRGGYQDKVTIAYDQLNDITVVTANEDITVTASNPESYLKLDLGNTPAVIGGKQGKFIKVGYEYGDATASVRGGDNFDVYMTITGAEGVNDPRFWSNKLALSASETSAVFDCVDQLKNGPLAGKYTEALTTADTYDFARIKPFADGTLEEGATFGIRYIAFFDNLEDAENYVYVPVVPTPKYNVTFKVAGEQYGEILVVDEGASLTYPEVNPTPESGYEFIGWDVPAGTLITADTTVNAIFEPVAPVIEPIALYTGEDIEFIGENGPASLQVSYENDIATATLPQFTGADTNRVQVKTPGALKGDGAQYMAYGIRISNVDSNDTDTTNRYAEESGKAERRWGGADTNQQYSTTEIKKHVIDFSKFNEWNKVLDTDKLLGIYLNPWSNGSYTCPADTVIEIEYIAFFDNLEDAEAYVFVPDDPTKATITYTVDGIVVYTEDVEIGTVINVPDVSVMDIPAQYEVTGWYVAEGTIVEDDMEIVAIFDTVELPLITPDIKGKDLNITGSTYWQKVEHNPSIAPDGDSMLLTATTEGWKNDGCVQFSINNVPYAGQKYIIINMSASSSKALVADGTYQTVDIDGHTYNVDFTPADGVDADIAIYLGDDFAGKTALNKITLDVFKNNRYEPTAADVHLKDVVIRINSIALPDFEIIINNELSEKVDSIYADYGAMFVLPESAVSAAENQRLIGWDVNGTQYAPGETVEVTETLVLTPVFETATEWYVVYKVEGIEVDTVTIPLGGTISHIATPSMPSGYELAGWINQATGEKVFNGDEVTTDMVLEALLKPTEDSDAGYIKTFILVLKHIQKKKVNGGTTKPSTAPTTGPVETLGKDLEVSGNGYWSNGSNGIGVNGNAMVATGNNNWQNNDTTDACADLIISNLATNGETKLTINLKITSPVAKLADGTGDKKVLADGTNKGSVIVEAGAFTKTFDIDFTPALDNETAIEIDLGSTFATAKTIDKLTLSMFKTNGGQLENVEVVINSIKAGDESDATVEAPVETPVETPTASADAVVFTAADLAIKGSDYLGNAEGTLADGILTMTVPSDAVAQDKARFAVSFADVPASNSFVALGIKVNGGELKSGDNINVNMNIGGTQTRMWGASTTYSTTEISKVVVDLTACTGGDAGMSWGQVAAGDVINGLTINPWVYDTTIPAGTTVDIQYVAFFATEAEANAFTFAG